MCVCVRERCCICEIESIPSCFVLLFHEINEIFEINRERERERERQREKERERERDKPLKLVTKLGYSFDLAIAIMLDK